MSLNRPGLRGDPGPGDSPRCSSPLPLHGRAGVNGERLQGWSRRWLPPPPRPPPLGVADSSFLFGLTASTWCACATILFLPPSPQAPVPPLPPPPCQQPSPLPPLPQPPPACGLLGAPLPMPNHHKHRPCGVNKHNICCH